MTILAHDVTVPARQRTRAGLGFAVLAAAAFGLSGPVASGLMASGWSPAALVLCRVGVAALVLAGPAIVALRGRWGLVLANARLIIAYGVVAVAGLQLAFFSAVGRLPVAIALLIEYTAPVGVVLWMWLRHRQRPARLTVAGAGVAGVGLLLVLDVIGSGSIDVLGVIFALAAMVCLVYYFVASAGEDHGLPPIVLAAGGLATGTVALAAAGVVGIVPMAASTASASYRGVELAWWLPLLALGVVTAAVAYVAGILASRRLGARMASFAALLEVLFAVIFAWLLLGQLPHVVQLIGGVFVLAGVVLVKLGEPVADVPTAPASATDALVAD